MYQKNSPSGASGLRFLFVVTFNPEWAAKNPEKVKERLAAFYERQRQADDMQKQVLENALRELSTIRRFRRIKKVSRGLRGFLSRKD